MLRADPTSSDWSTSHRSWLREFCGSGSDIRYRLAQTLGIVIERPKGTSEERLKGYQL